MTAPARITQADMERATRAASDAVERVGKPARVIFRLEQREIEIIVGESAPPDRQEDVWSDDDV